MMASTFNQTNEACQVTKLRRWHAIAWSMESMLWKAFPMQLRWSTRCLGFSGQRERKTSSGRARLRRRQDSLHVPGTICFWFESIWHPTASLLMSKGMKSVSSVKNLTTHGFIRWLIGISIIPTDPFAVHPVHWCRTCQRDWKKKYF